MKLSDGLISGKLAACVNIVSVESVFRWKGVIEDQSEKLLIIKSVRSRFDEITRFIKENHSYDCPEIIANKAETVSEDYAAWVRSECSD